MMGISMRVRLRASRGWWLGVLLGAVGCGVLRGQFSGPALRIPAQPNQVQTPTAVSDLLAMQSPDTTITAGDVLTIRIFGAVDYAPVVKVGPNGSVQLPLIGVIQLGGLSVTRAEDAIAQSLVAAGMYKNPSVTIQITEYSQQFVTVEGEARSALVPVSGERKLLDILAAAGGLPSTASHVITILRPGVEKPIVVDLGTDPSRSAETNIVIRPRDTILIARVGVVYMIGAFLRQGAIPLDQKSPLTLLEACSLTGGVGFEGRFEEVKIIRTTGNERHYVKVDIKRILKGKNPDPILQADDIVVLPTNLLKAAFKNGGIGTVIGLTQIGINAFR